MTCRDSPIHPHLLPHDSLTAGHTKQTVCRSQFLMEPEQTQDMRWSLSAGLGTLLCLLIRASGGSLLISTLLWMSIFRVWLKTLKHLHRCSWHWWKGQRWSEVQHRHLTSVPNTLQDLSCMLIFSNIKQSAKSHQCLQFATQLLFSLLSGPLHPSSPLQLLQAVSSFVLLCSLTAADLQT